MTNQKYIIDWLLQGDVSIQYQVYRDILGQERPGLRSRIAGEGWGKKYLTHRKSDGHWGQGFYQPKWTSTHYTVLDLRNLNLNPDHPDLQNTVQIIFRDHKSPDGGINPHREIEHSDVCITGMAMNYGCYFGIAENDLQSVVDFLLAEQMPDGGFNCHSNRGGAVHSSLHSTISVLEGITEYEKNGYQYRLEELSAVKDAAIEFMLLHQLYLSDRTGEIIKPDFLRFPYPTRWKYDILRALDYFQYAEVPWDDRMKKAIEVLLKKRNKGGTWNLNAKYPGQVHFEMEKAGKPSRWNTLRALRLLRYFKVPGFNTNQYEG